MSVKDHFSGHSAEYQRYRPGYPPELAAFLARSAPGTAVALDAATGNGQAALDLARHFGCVLASEASWNQLRHRTPHERVFYLRHAAEQLPVRSGAADLVAVAQAARWFDLPRFCAEARRVPRPRGVVALWTYSLVKDGRRRRCAGRRLLPRARRLLLATRAPARRRALREPGVPLRAAAGARLRA